MLTLEWRMYCLWSEEQPYWFWGQGQTCKVWICCVVVNWLFNITINAISVIYVTAHRCASGLKKLDLRSGSQQHRHFVGFFKARPSSDWEGKGPWAIVPLTWKMAHKSQCRMIQNGPLKISKSLKKAENGPFGKKPLPNHCDLAPTRGHPFYTVIFRETAPFNRLLQHAEDTEDTFVAAGAFVPFRTGFIVTVG